MTFRCMPAFQTLGGGDCGASWVSASRLRKDTVAIVVITSTRAPDDPSSANSLKCFAANIFRWFRHSLTSSSPFSPPSVSAWRATPNADKPHAIQRTRIGDICASVRFYSINSLSSFSKRFYRLGVSSLRNFIEIFSEMRNDIFLRARRYQSFCYQKLSAHTSKLF